MLGGAAAAALPAVAVAEAALASPVAAPTVAVTMESDFVTYVITAIYPGTNRMAIEPDTLEIQPVPEGVAPGFQVGGLCSTWELPAHSGLEVGDRIAIYSPQGRPAALITAPGRPGGLSTTGP